MKTGNESVISPLLRVRLLNEIEFVTPFSYFVEYRVDSTVFTIIIIFSRGFWTAAVGPQWPALWEKIQVVEAGR